MDSLHTVRKFKLPAKKKQNAVKQSAVKQNAVSDVVATSTLSAILVLHGYHKDTTVENQEQDDGHAMDRVQLYNPCFQNEVITTLRKPLHKEFSITC